MTAQEYIDNGLVLDYCLDLMDPSEKAAFERVLGLSAMLRREVASVQKGMDNYGATHKAVPDNNMKDRIWATLENLIKEQQMDLKDLPLINKYSDAATWLSAVRSLLPEKKEGFFAHVLTGTPAVTQVLIQSSVDIPDEVHGDVYESFIILEGECECHIGDRVIHVKAGGFIEIPLHQHHDVKVLSPYVIGIMQRIAA